MTFENAIPTHDDFVNLVHYDPEPTTVAACRAIREAGYADRKNGTTLSDVVANPFFEEPVVHCNSRLAHKNLGK